MSAPWAAPTATERRVTELVQEVQVACQQWEADGNAKNAEDDELVWDMAQCVIAGETPAVARGVFQELGFA
jgi:hypothetical protein